MKKKDLKRKLKRESNREKQEQHRIDSLEQGILIEENHHGGPYSPEFTLQSREFWLHKLSTCPPERFNFFFCQSRPRLQTLILKWSDQVEWGEEFFMIKYLLDVYRYIPDQVYTEYRRIRDGIITPPSFERLYLGRWNEIH